jgi:uncharacterized membrane protein
MSWERRFRIREYLRGSLWVLPLAGGVLGVLLGSGVVALDKSVSPPTGLTYSPSTASTLLTAIVGATAALTGFVVTVTVLVVQMATGTFSARYMRIWYRDRMLKAVLALLVGTLAFSFTLLRRVESNFVPNLGTSIAGVLLIVSLLVFLIFLDRFLHRLRPVAVAALVSRYVRRDFAPTERRLAAAPDVFCGTVQDRAEPPSVVAHSAKAGAIQVMRRMRALLEELQDEVREDHRPAIDEELARLDATVARNFADSVDIDRARVSDPQGIGGRSGAVTRGPVP